MKFVQVLLIVLIPAIASAATATVTIDYNNDQHFYERDMAFGTNFLGEWTEFKLYKDNIYRFQQAGTRFWRFPGGSNSNEYHWNGGGSYDADKVWHVNNSPNVTAYSRGFYNLSAHRGSSSIGYGKPAVLTDGKTSTYWLSYPDSEGLQWAYLDIQTASFSAVPVNRIVIDWNTPYAAQYKIQYSNGNWNGMGQWAYNDTAWTDTTQNNVAGAGGQADLLFNTVTAKYVRVLCQSSSGASNQFAINEIRLYYGATQITSNVYSVTQTPSVASSMALGDNFQEYDTMSFEEYMSAVKSMTPPAEPMITINFFTGTTQEAADWVYYANVHRNYGIKYWEIGNENWGTWESGGPCDPVNYAKRFIALYDAMTAVDPSIIIAPQFNTIQDRSNVTMTAGTNNPSAYDFYIDTFLKYLADHGRAGILKGLSVHRYPSWMPAAEATPLAVVDLWNTDLPLVKSWVNNRCTNPSEVKYWLTEYNDGIDSAFTNRFYNSLWVTSYVLNYLRNGGDYTCFFRPFGTPGPGQTDKTIYSDFGYLEGGALGGSYANYRYQPRASFYAFEMMYNRFSADDSFGNTLVSAASSNNSLKVYANKRGDRKLSIALVNIDQNTAIDAAITIAGFAPLAAAEQVSYTRQNYSWVLNGTNSYASPDTPPVISQYNSAAQSFTYSVEPYSVKMLTLYDASRPTLAPSMTPTMLPTPTITPTQYPNGILLDDCEDGNLMDLWGGQWSIYGDTVSSYPSVIPFMTCDGTGADSSNCYMRVTGTVINNSWGFGVNAPFNPSWGPVDISMYDGVFFWYKGASVSARLALPQEDITNGNYGIDFNINTSWTYYQIPFTSLTHATWSGAPMGTWTGTNVRYVSFQVFGGYPGPAYREINVDSIGFYRNTPTVTPTQTQAPTPATEADLKNVRVYPMPCNMKDGGCDGFTFDNLTAHIVLKIFTVNGDLIYKYEADTPTGEYFWDVRAMRKSQFIPAGFYIYVIQNEKKETAKGRIAVIR